MMDSEPVMDKNYVDTTQTITHIGLCAGYGGIELGLKRVIPTLRSVALCEIEAFACANLVAKMEAGLMEPSPIWTDLKTFPWRAFRDRVDILTGGYPCQPFSAAGRRRGKDDPRHLWPWIADGIELLRPRVCFFENVEGHISMGLSDVIEDLVGMGYRVAWGIFSAAEVGAPHQRKRVFIMAHRIGTGLEGLLPDAGAQGWEVAWGSSAGCSQDSREWRQAWPSRPGEPQHEWEPPRVVADTNKWGRTIDTVIGEMDCETGSEGGGGDQSTSTSPDCGDAGAEETTLANNHRPDAGHGEKRSERTERDLSGRCCEGRETEGMAHAHGGRGEEPRHKHADILTEPSGGNGEAVGNADGGADAERQIEPPLGGDADGSARGLDYAELCESCDNRTDELRLLGNGVVPATAERAFRVLMAKLTRAAIQR